MMAPEALDAFDPPPVATNDGHDAFSSSGSGPISGRAPLRWPQTMRHPADTARDSSLLSRESGEASNSDVEGDDERGQESDGRGCVSRSDCYVSSTSDEASSAVLSTAQPGSSQLGEQPGAALQPVTRDALAARAKAVFDPSAGWPTEVRQPLLASVVTNQVIRDAIAVCEELCDRDGKALSQAFGNFDRRVALGWLLADAAGLKLLDRSQAHALGIKAQRADGAGKAAIRDARRRAIARARADGADVSAAQDEAEAALLQVDARVISSQQPPDPAPAARSSSGARKRAREAEPSREHVHQQRVSEAESRLRTAEKFVSRTETLLEKAEAASDAAFQRLKRAVACNEASASVSNAEFNRLHKAYRVADEKSNEAQMNELQAENDWLLARLVERDAEIDLLMLQWGHSCKQLENSVATASTALSSAKRLHEISMFRSSEHGSTVESDHDP